MSILALVFVALAGNSGAWAGFNSSTTAPSNSFSTGTFDCPSRSSLPTASLYYSYMPVSGASEPDLSTGGSAQPGTLVGDATRVAGTCSGNLSPNVAVSGAGLVATATKVPAPTAYSISVWFKPTVAGGMLADFGDRSTTSGSTVTDRQIYYQADGSLAAGQLLGGTAAGCSISRTIVLSKWHLAVATFDPGSGSGATLTLYLDGTSATCSAPGLTGSASSSNAYWRFGGDTLSSSTWTSASSSGYFSGALDETAVYPTALTSAQVGSIWTLGH